MTDDLNQPKRRSGLQGWLLVALLAFLGGMLGSPWLEARVRGALPQWAQPAAPAKAATDNASAKALEARIAAMETRPGNALPADIAARLAALEAGRTADGAGAATLASDLGPMSDRLGQLEVRISALESAVRSATQAATQVQGFQGQLMTLQSGSTEQALRLRALASLVPLRRSLDAGVEGGEFVDAVAQALPAGSGDVVALRALAGRPVTLAGLQRSFAKLDQQRNELVSSAPQSQSWLDTAIGQARSLISAKARRSAEYAAAPLDAARAALSVGNVAAASRQLATLADHQRYAQWLEEAARFEAGRAALARVETALARQPPAALVPMAPAPAIR